MQSRNLIGIGKAGLSFVEFLMARGAEPKNCTVLLNEKKSPERPENIHNIFCTKSSAELDYKKIVKKQDIQKPCLVVFGGAGKFSGKTALELSKVLKLRDKESEFILIGPFKFEGEKAKDRANNILTKLREEHVISHYFSNQDIFSLISPNASFEEGFAKINAEIFWFYKNLRK